MAKPASDLKVALIASGAITADALSGEVQSFLNSGALKIESDTSTVRTRDEDGKVVNERKVDYSFIAVNPEHADAIPAALALVGNDTETFVALINAEIKSQAALNSRGPDPVEKAANDYIRLMGQFGKKVTLAEAMDAVRKMREQ